MRDVAREAGVSIKTVSRVVNGQGEVSEETRRRVAAAIEKLGYRPSKVARALVTRRTDTMGLVIGDITNPYFADVARGVFEVAGEASYDVFVCNTNGDPAAERRAIQSLQDHHIDGTIVYPTWESSQWIEQQGTHLSQIVIVNSDVPPRQGLGIVKTEILVGARMAVEYLIEKGHRQIGMIAGEDYSWTKVRRVEGYREALLAHDIPFCAERIIGVPPLLEHGTLAVKRLLADQPDLTAIFCYNDLLAIGAIVGCRELGVKVPEQCAIVGFDDIKIGALVTPALTTIHVDKVEIGRQAADCLLTMLKRPDTPIPPIIMDVELVGRESA